MRIERDRPRAHLVVDGFFFQPALEAILGEVRALEPEMKPGLVREVGHDGQSVFFEHGRRQNKAVWIHDPSETLRLFREQLWSKSMVHSFEDAREPLFQIIPSCWAPHLQVSTYRTGDHYDFHEDEGAGVNLTAVVFLAENPKTIRGGDLVLAYRGEQVAIRFRHNRLVIFPSKTPHRVTRVRVDSDDPRDARISLQCWLTHGRPPSTGKRRAPVTVADSPTFLLVEAPIIAAARRMIDSSKTPDQTPEDVYWGAFYLSRILTQNLRCLLASQSDLEIGPLRIRRRGALEVYGRVRLGDKLARVGFVLRGAEVAAEEALSLFVETGRGAKASLVVSVVPQHATERHMSATLRRLFARAAPRA